MAGRNCNEAQHCVLTNYGGKLVLGEGTNLVVDTSKCLQLQFIVNNNGYYGYALLNKFKLSDALSQYKCPRAHHNRS